MLTLHRAILSLTLLLATLSAHADLAPSLEIGAVAPDFCLKGVDDKEYCLKDFAEAKVLAVIFNCPHCPSAQAAEDRIQQLHVDYKDKGVAVVVINPNDPLALRLDELAYTDLGDSFEDMKIRAAEKGFTHPYLYDGDTQTVARAYGPVSTPHVFVFDAERKLRYRGRLDNSEKEGKAEKQETRDAIDALLAGTKVEVETTQPFGCSTKWSDKRPSVVEALEKWKKEEVKLDSIDAEGVKNLLKNDSEKLRLINVWATWCGPCVAEFPELVDINRIYRIREFEMVTISTDEPKLNEKVLKFLKKNEASTTNYQFNSDDIDDFSAAFDKEWTGAIPYTLLVAPGGKIIYRHQGLIDALEVKKAIIGYLGRSLG